MAKKNGQFNIFHLTALCNLVIIKDGLLELYHALFDKLGMLLNPDAITWTPVVTAGVISVVCLLRQSKKPAWYATVLFAGMLLARVCSMVPEGGISAAFVCLYILDAYVIYGVTILFFFYVPYFETIYRSSRFPLSLPDGMAFLGVYYLVLSFAGSAVELLVLFDPSSYTFSFLRFLFAPMCCCMAGIGFIACNRAFVLTGLLARAAIIACVYHHSLLNAFITINTVALLLTLTVYRKKLAPGFTDYTCNDRAVR